MYIIGHADGAYSILFTAHTVFVLMAAQSDVLTCVEDPSPQVENLCLT